MAINCVDWRGADERELAALYTGEVGRWTVALGWDTAASWHHVEVGRRLGTVPGLLARDDRGAIVGWTFYLLHDHVLQIGGLVAQSDAAAAALVDGIFASGAAVRARSAMAFVFSDVPGLPRLFSGRGLMVAGYDYMSKDLAAGDRPGAAPPRAPATQDAAGHAPDAAGANATDAALRAWDAADLPAIAALLAEAYPGADALRPFASSGRLDDWRAYAGQLVNASGCGTIMPAASFVAASGANRLDGVVLVTRLAARTAHIAQIAVDPGAQRRGLGERLVRAACDRARAAGCDRLTLLVESGNVRARRLYGDLEFSAVAAFVAAASATPVEPGSSD